MTSKSDKSNQTPEDVSPTYRLSVVAKTADGKFMDRHVDLCMSLMTAEDMLETVKKRGFTTEGIRIFPDQIESLQLYELDEEGNPRSTE